MRRRTSYKRFLTCMLAAAMVMGSAVPAFAEADGTSEPQADATVSTDGSVYLDLEEKTEEVDLPQYQDIDQYYDVTVESQFKDVTKVKLEWKTANIKASYKKNQRWNPDKLQWENNPSAAKGLEVSHGFPDGKYAGKDAVFTLTNLSSVKVNAKAAFSVEEILKETYTSVAFDDGTDSIDENGIAIDTVVKDDDARTVDSERTHAATINAALTLNTDAFGDLAAVKGGKYGTYTITIGSSAEAEETKYVQMGKFGFSDAFFTIYDKAKTVTFAASYSPEAGETGVDVSATKDSSVLMYCDEEGNITFAPSEKNAGAKIQITDASDMFYECNKITTIDFTNLDTSMAENMSCMFYNCSSLTELNLSNFDTSKVTDMSWMFYKCSGLTELDLSSFDTTKTTDMSYMFKYCSSLTKLNLNSFDTAQVAAMVSMFEKCSSLTELDLSNFDTTKVIDMSSMFSNCSSLEELDLSSFDTAYVTNMSLMFCNCSKLKNLSLGTNFVTTASTNTYDMFSNCPEDVVGKYSYLEIELPDL